MHRNPLLCLPESLNKARVDQLQAWLQHSSAKSLRVHIGALAVQARLAAAEILISSLPREDERQQAVEKAEECARYEWLLELLDQLATGRTEPGNEQSEPYKYLTLKVTIDL